MSKKSLVSIVYEYDTLLARGERITSTMDFINKTKEGSNRFFIKLLKHIKSIYKRNKLNGISTVLEDNYLSVAFEAIFFDFLHTKIKKKSSIIDITDEGIDN